MLCNGAKPGALLKVHPKAMGQPRLLGDKGGLKRLAGNPLLRQPPAKHDPQNKTHQGREGEGYPREFKLGRLNPVVCYCSKEHNYCPK